MELFFFLFVEQNGKIKNLFVPREYHPKTIKKSSEEIGIERVFRFLIQTEPYERLISNSRVRVSFSSSSSESGELLFVRSKP